MILLLFNQRVIFGEKSYTGKISAFPDDGSALPEQSLEVTHADHRIEQEADKMGKGEMRDTIGRPGTVMIHFRDTSMSN